MLLSNDTPNCVPRVTLSVVSATLTVTVSPEARFTLEGLMERLVTVETTPGTVGVEVGTGTVGLPGMVGNGVDVAFDVAPSVGVVEGVTAGVLDGGSAGVLEGVTVSVGVGVSVGVAVALTVTGVPPGPRMSSRVAELLMLASPG